MKVKFLLHCGPYVPGQEVDLPDKEAEVVCKKTVVDKGGVLVEQRKAMPLAEVEKLKTMPVDMAKVTQHELSEMGRKNIVPTPKDAAFEAQLAKAMQPPADKKKADKGKKDDVE